MSAEARHRIEQLLARYAELIDAGDFTGIGDLLADAVVTTADGTPIARGRDEVTAMYEASTRRYPEGTPRTRHLITNLIVEPELDADGGESAGNADDGGPGAERYVARSCFTVLQATDGLPLQPIITGRYRDVVEQGRDGGWRFVERRMVPELFGDLTHHLLFDASALS